MERREEQPVCVCTLHTEAKKSNCLLNTSEVKGWLGMRGVVAQPAVISLRKGQMSLPLDLPRACQIWTNGDLRRYYRAALEIPITR